jgi:peptidoglycan/LPS O-acetylase OafA/YrhL
VVYLKGLNGIRAIAAIAVVISHITLSFPSFGLDPYIFGRYDDGNPRTLDLAGYGVSMFFGLSGFLITYLLCKEREKLKIIDVKKIYMRRILRIWPLYYTYFFICIISYFIFGTNFQTSSIFYYLFYGANIPFIIGGALPHLAHYWSLGVEEQFYMFWPWLRKFDNSKLFSISLILTIILLGLKIYLHIFIPDTMLERTIHVTRFHCMLLGAMSAILYYEQHHLFIKIATTKAVQVVCWICLSFVALNRFHIASFLDNEIITGITCLIIIGQITGKGIISLENNIFDFLGKISYGIYVIHPLLIFLFSKILKDITSLAIVNYLLVYTSILATTIIIAHLSYQYFEKPFLRLKTKKYSVIQSSGTKNQAH